MRSWEQEKQHAYFAMIGQWMQFILFYFKKGQKKKVLFSHNSWK